MSFMDPLDMPTIAITPFLFIAIALIIAVVIAVKYKAELELLVVVCSTVGGFLIGCVMNPTGYVSIGLAMTTATAAFLLSVAAVAYARILKTKKASTQK